MKRSFVVPEWKNRVAPCGGEVGCPAHTNIAASLYSLSLGDARGAWITMMESHPMRAVLGRVCYQFCEKPCNRGFFDSPISIQALEAVIGDEGFDPDWRPKLARRNGKKVLIIGAGPAGLAAGWFLNISGFSAVIYDAQEKPGGVLRHGIPSYRLPKDILDREIKLITDSGVKIHLKKKISDKELKSLLAKKKFDAAIIAVGAGKSVKAGFTGEKNALNGIEFLKKVNAPERSASGFAKKNVVVIGGGNVAMDACRSAVRLGAKSVKVIYRRTEDMMPAHSHEIKQAKEEGVEFIFLTAPEKFSGKTLSARKMKLGAPDSSGREEPLPTNEFLDIPADVVITAAGQKPAKWKISGLKNVFFAGDAAPDSVGTVIHAIASGKEAANEISVKLTKKQMFEPVGEEVPYEKLNIKRYFEPGMRMRNLLEKPSGRRNNFRMVERKHTLEEGIVEAKRCFVCGVCVGGINSDCDWCFRACDESKSIIKFMEPWNSAGPFFERTDDCDACGRCWEDCPRYVVAPIEVEDGGK